MLLKKKKVLSFYSFKSFLNVGILFSHTKGLFFSVEIVMLQKYIPRIIVSREGLFISHDLQFSSLNRWNCEVKPFCSF